MPAAEPMPRTACPTKPLQAFRDNERLSVEDPALAQQLWEGTGLCEAMRGVEVDGGAAVGLNPLIRVYRYDKGQRFGRHIDESVEVTSRPRGITQYTLLIYLSDPQGGETLFYDLRGRRAASVKPRTGLALLHLHGDECMEHEGAAVTGGVKYVLRSDVVFA
jgi:predicted 2-oxoglutarate/Fe(II)-dependent dioxygenase YbiX